MPYKHLMGMGASNHIVNAFEIPFANGCSSGLKKQLNYHQYHTIDNKDTFFFLISKHATKLLTVFRC